MNNKIKGILCIIGAIITHLLLGNVYTWSNIHPYVCSYLRLKEYERTGKKSTVLNDTYFLSPITLSVQNGLMILSSIIEPKIGVRFTVLITMILLSTSYTLLYLFPYFSVTILCMVLNGMASALSYFSVINNSWRYFPEKKGIITGIVLSVFGGSAFVFTTFGDLILNPHKLKTDDEGYYEDEVAKNVKKYYLILMFIVFGLAILGISFAIPHQKETVTDTLVSGDTEDINKKEEEKEQTTESDIYKKPIDDEPRMVALKSPQFLFYLVFVLFTAFYAFSMSNLYRAFGNLNALNQNMLMWLSRVYALLNFMARIFWGFMVDTFGFFIPYLTLVIIFLGVSVSFYFCRSSEVLYFMINMFAVLSSSGLITLPFSFVGKKYGIKNSMFLVGIVAMIKSVSSISGPILIKVLVHKRVSDYLNFFIIDSVLAGICLVMVFFLDFNKFDYGKKTNDEEEQVRNIDGSIVDNKDVTLDGDKIKQ